jgi:hypothetical protein
VALNTPGAKFHARPDIYICELLEIFQAQTRVFIKTTKPERGNVAKFSYKATPTIEINSFERQLKTSLILDRFHESGKLWYANCFKMLRKLSIEACRGSMLRLEKCA